MRKGLIPFFGPMYQIIFSVIVIMFVFTCINSFTSTNTEYDKFVSSRGAMSTACSSEPGSSAGPMLYQTYFIIQLYGSESCDTTLETLNENNKFRPESSCSYENCDGGFCLCMGKTAPPASFPGYDIVSDAMTTLSDIQTDRSNACNDLANTDLYEIGDGSMCCIGVPVECFFVAVDVDPGYEVLDGIYAKGADIEISGMSFEKVDTGGPLEPFLAIYKI